MTMTIPYNIETHDGLIGDSMMDKIWDYVQDQVWHHVWLPEARKFNTYRPNENNYSWLFGQAEGRKSIMHRTVFSSDAEGLKEMHLPIYALWKEINHQLGNKFELTGVPENMSYPIEDEAPPTKDPNIKQGWRCYANGVHNTSIISIGFVHRDTYELDDDTSVTILYVANREWYPSWGAEVRYYPNDPDGVTGDHQQFNFGGQQQRGFNIGWLDYGKIVSPVPGRIIVHDGRCLHATGATRTMIDTPSVKIVFRARLKNTAGIV